MRLIVNGFMGATAVAYGLADTVQQFPLGVRAFGHPGDYSTVANVLNASGEFMYCQVGGAVACGTPVTFNTNTFTIAGIANTANLGCALGIAANRFTASGQFGWVQVSGVAPVVNNGTFAADVAVFIVAAGTLSSTVAAGKQILGARSLIAAAATFTKSCETVNGSTQLKVPNTDGLFAGLAVSGTGIAASVINDIDPGTNLVTLSAAMTANGKGITTTFTYTNLGALVMNHPLAQGQIT